MNPILKPFVLPILKRLNKPKSMIGGIERCAKRGINPTTIIDIGAAEGNWTREVLPYWKNSNYLLFEPLPQRAEQLDALAAQYPNVRIVKAGAGNKIGTVDFFITDDLDGSGIADNGTNAQKVTIPVTTIDDEIAKHQLKGSYLVKLDTHGYEVPILEGATKTLANACLVIIECYGLQIAPNSLLMWEMCAYMDKLGFRMVDLVDTLQRAKDGLFWQCDVFFEPKTKPYFTHNTYNY